METHLEITRHGGRRQGGTRGGQRSRSGHARGAHGRPRRPGEVIHRARAHAEHRGSAAHPDRPRNGLATGGGGAAGEVFDPPQAVQVLGEQARHAFDVGGAGLGRQKHVQFPDLHARRAISPHIEGVAKRGQTGVRMCM